ncbi:MAG: hypothetical protein IIZ33_08520, partial [Erysipelotrichaceae bacterium]|nr:hypothetical protein [Erysipelotrichaceae bacterium]
MKKLKSLLSALLTVLMLVTNIPANVVAEEVPAPTPKVEVNVSSTRKDGGVTTVSGVINPDYSMVLTLPNQKVNASNVKVDVAVTDIHSLGIEGTRRASEALNTGMSAEVYLYEALKLVAGEGQEHLFGFNGATVNVRVLTDNTARDVVYTLAGSGFDGSEGSVKTITASTDEAAARDAWLALADKKNAEVTTKADHDSYIIVANGSTLQLGREVLKFETAQDLRLDNFNDLQALEKNIRAHTVLEQNAAVSAYTFTIKKGSILAVDQTIATLKRDVKVTLGFDQEAAILSTLRATSSLKDMVRFLMKTGNDFLGMFDGETVNLTIEVEHIHEWEEPVWNWSEDARSCTAVFHCKYDSEVREVPAEVTETEEGHLATVSWPEDGLKPEGAEDVLTNLRKRNEVNNDVKFRVEVSSKDGAKEGLVVGTVYDDYRAELLMEGESVNTSNALLEIWMHNVASLGVSDTRYYRRAVQTNYAPQSVSMDTVRSALSPLGAEGTKVTAKYNDLQTTYTFSKDGNKIIAKPDENTSAMWHALVNSENVEAGTREQEDSYFLIKKGSTLQIGNQLLEFEEDVKDLKLDNFNDLNNLNKNIRDHVKLTTLDKSVNKVVFYLEEGSELAVGSSYAKALKEVKVSVDVYDEELPAVLTGLQASENGTEMLKAMFRVMTAVIERVSGKETVVEIELGHKWSVKEWSWSEDYETAKLTLLCDNNKTHEITKNAVVAKDTTEANCETDGKVVYNAKVTYEGVEYTDSREKDVPATGHDWAEPVYKWSEDHLTVTATKACKNNEEHNITETVTAIVTERPATGYAEGKIVYTAEFENDAFTTQSYVETIDKLDYKFIAQVSSVDNSGKTGSVTGTVYPDYKADLVFAGEKVNTSNVLF